MTYNKELVREKFKDLFEYSLDLIFVNNFRGNFLDANDLALENLGYERGEISNINYKDLISKDQLSLAFKALMEIRDLGKQLAHTEYKLKTKNGEFLYVETYGIPLRQDGKIYGILGVARDITQLRLVELKLKESGKQLKNLNIGLEQKIIERTKELKESEEKYRLISENANDLIAVVNQQSKFEYINENIHIKILGFSKDDLIGKSTLEITHPDDINNTIKSFKKGFEHGELIDLVRLKDKNGIYHWLEVRGKRFKDQDGENKILMIARDITEKKEAAQKLKESGEKYRLISENANDLITILNQKFEHEYINEETYLKILGYSNDDMLGKTRLDLIHPDDLKQGMKALRNGFKYGEGVAELRLKHKDGHYIWIETKEKTYIDSNRETKVLTISRDISERKKVEQKLKESEKKYRSILENIEEGYFELDLKGNYTFINEYHSNFFDVPKDEMIGKNYSDFVDQKYKKMLFKIFNQVYREEVPSATFEVEATRYDGEKRIYEGTCNIKLDSNGKKIGFYSLTRDITERKKMEALKEKFTEQLKIEVDMKTKELQETISQQKLYLEQIVKASQFKTEFMGSMSHELRTPLNAIIGFTDLLLESSYGPVNEDQFDFLKDIKSSGEHLLHMIDQILDISKIEAGELILKFQEIHLKSHITQIKTSIQPMYEKKKLKFEIIGLDTDKYIYADSIRLKEIFYNLLTNAIKFTNKGKITLKILEKEDQWEFQVIDTGIGIAKEDFNIIFKEFKRVESPEVIAILGSGLGLPITRKLVYMHGGTISFTSNVGKGSTFVFTIPKNLEQKNQE